MATNSNRDVSNGENGFQPSQESLNNQELALIEAAKMGDENAKADLISLYSGLIHKIVVSHQRGSFPYDAYPDMFNEGCIAFLRAVELYDATKGATLGTYAHMWVQQAIKRHVYRHSGHMNLPPEKCRMAAKVLKLLSDGMTHQEVKEELEIDQATMDAILRAKISMVTLEGTVAEESQALIDSIAGTVDVENDVMNDLLGEALYRWIDKLEPEEITLLSLRYGLSGNHNHTFEEIATIMDPKNFSNDPEVKSLKKGRVIAMCERAEQKLYKIAMRESESAKALSSTSMFSQPIKTDKDMDVDFEPGIGSVSG